MKKYKLKHAIWDAKRKNRIQKYQFDFISFSFVVGPGVSATERVIEHTDGHIKCDFAFIINTKYDYEKYGNKRICIGDHRIK